MSAETTKVRRRADQRREVVSERGIVTFRFPGSVRVVEPIGAVDWIEVLAAEVLTAEPRSEHPATLSLATCACARWTTRAE